MHPGATYMVIVILTGSVAFCTRAMISSLNTLADVAVMSVYFGFLEFIARITLQLRDTLGYRLLRCKPPTRTFFDDPKRIRFIADTILTEMYFEMFGVCMCVCVYVHMCVYTYCVYA